MRAALAGGIVTARVAVTDVAPAERPVLVSIEDPPVEAPLEGAPVEAPLEGAPVEAPLEGAPEMIPADPIPLRTMTSSPSGPETDAMTRRPTIVVAWMASTLPPMGSRRPSSRSCESSRG